MVIYDLYDMYDWYKWYNWWLLVCMSANLLIFNFMSICNTISVFYINEESYKKNKIVKDMSIWYRVIEIVFYIKISKKIIVQIIYDEEYMIKNKLSITL